jgi:AraC-like DNA-binding protein
VYYVKPGQALLLDVTENVKGHVISFAREFVELYETKGSELFNTQLFHPSASTPVIHIRNDVAYFMASIANEMMQEYRSYLDLRVEILKGFLKIFIIYLSRQAQTADATTVWSRKADLVNLFFTHLEKHFAAKKMVKEYAEMLTVSPNYLNDTVKEISGYTASHHIQQRIVLEAKRKAVFEGYSMKEAAYDLGFFDPSHFSKYFKNCSGINFTDFKKGAVGLC